MSHPFKSHAHKNDPKWVRGLDPYVESNLNTGVEKAKVEDTDVTLRYNGGDPAITHRSADYTRPKGED